MNKAFSLIELLVTVAIIAMLSVVSYPSISKIADKENLRTAKSELRNCYLMAKAYARAPRIAAATSYQAAYDQQGCQVIEVAATNTVIEQYRFGSTDYRFKDPSGATKMVITITTAPPYQLTATEGDTNTEIPAGTTLMIEVDNVTSNDSGSIFINMNTGVISSDA